MAKKYTLQDWDREFDALQKAATKSIATRYVIHAHALDAGYTPETIAEHAVKTGRLSPTIYKGETLKTNRPEQSVIKLVQETGTENVYQAADMLESWKGARPKDSEFKKLLRSIRDGKAKPEPKALEAIIKERGTGEPQPLTKKKVHERLDKLLKAAKKDNSRQYRAWFKEWIAAEFPA